MFNFSPSWSGIDMHVCTYKKLCIITTCNVLIPHSFSILLFLAQQCLLFLRFRSPLSWSFFFVHTDALCGYGCVCVYGFENHWVSSTLISTVIFCVSFLIQFLSSDTDLLVFLLLPSPQLRTQVQANCVLNFIELSKEFFSLKLGCTLGVFFLRKYLYL